MCGTSFEALFVSALLYAQLDHVMEKDVQIVTRGLTVSWQSQCRYSHDNHSTTEAVVEKEQLHMISIRD